ncbi:MAG: tRNA (N(6)-L-threonylcarbamoyladenosine(37)-C(2))-methylthiotransferase MtaB [Ruminococcaceae bacterium]|nr:tRNA (N(6)-L-threonylcarbamoyladenosine(37)-C(2))-methylthiotransferase MtaB [Oscillospiraceae bacterium]
MKVKFYTLGCKVNQYESQAISEALAKRGYETVTDGKADIFIVNSCTVTASADQKTRQAVRRFKRNNPDSVVVLTGCMPQAYPEKSKELLEADIILGNRSNEEIANAIEQFLKFGSRVFEIREHKRGDAFSGTTISRFEERTRAYIKIQDGCNRFCSYCIIPYSRGRVRSKPLDELKKEIEVLARGGYKEVVLVGINLSSYGSDIGLTFPDAVRAANDTEGIERVRLGSLEPDHLTDEVIESLARCEKLCPQFHISLQSGCDNTLKRMNRHYTADEYRQICRKLRESFSDCTLTTDVMVGFAGESEEDFRESLDFVKEIGFEKVHVFPYSVRKGTKAESFGGHIDKKTKEERSRLMTQTADEIRKSFFRNQTGRKYSVLFETADKDGYCCGHTANYIPVKVKISGEMCHKTADVIIREAAEDDFCIGEAVK